MLKPKINMFATGMLILLVVISFSAISFRSKISAQSPCPADRPACAGQSTASGSSGGSSSGNAGAPACDPAKDWWCHGRCDNSPDKDGKPKHVLTAGQYLSCKCDGTPNLTGDALKSCQACQNPNDQNGCLSQNPITKRINVIINLLSGLVAVIITANLIVGGIQYALSGESASVVQASKKRMVNSAVAFLAFILTYALLQWLIPGGF